MGDVVGVRGPFGTDWGLASLDGVDVVVVAGGIGLAPLRGAMRYLAENKSPERTVALRVGARLPDQIVFPDEIARWGEMGIDVAVTVDVADAGWTGHVGVVTQILAELPFDGAGAVALVCGPEIMMRFSARSLIDLGVTPENIRVSLERNMQCGIAMCGHCQLGPYLLCRDGPVVPYASARGGADHRERTMTSRPTLAVWKFASCDGCQLGILDCEDELLQLAQAVQIASFTEMTSAVIEGPYDVSLVEGSITTPDDADRILAVRAASGLLVTIGACATAGGIQALRNYANVGEYTSTVYAHPEYISTLAESSPISSYVPVDFELRGCPINRLQLIEVVTALLAGRRPVIPGYSVCEECKTAGNLCVLVAHGTPCLGPVNTRRLRRPLPGGEPRLLRLLRPGEHDEHRVAFEAARRSRPVRAGGVADVPDLQLRRDRVRKGESRA